MVELEEKKDGVLLKRCVLDKVAAESTQTHAQKKGYVEEKKDRKKERARDRRIDGEIEILGGVVAEREKRGVQETHNGIDDWKRGGCNALLLEIEERSCEVLASLNAERLKTKGGIISHVKKYY